MRSVEAAMTVEVIRTPRGEMPTYVAAPAARDPWPGVVVIHDFCGMSHDLRNQANWLAGEGYLAAAPDLYYRGSRLRCLWTIMREIAAGAGRTFDDIDSVRGWLVRHDRCTGKIGVIGFCMGGAYAVALAPGHGYAAASVNYGGCPKDAELVRRVRAALVIGVWSFGETRSRPPVRCQPLPVLPRRARRTA
jgi:carboxymethylenebutenolidase